MGRKGGKLERNFQPKLIEELYSTFPGCIVNKNDEQYRQGMPDLTVYFGPKYAILECKKSANESYRPNQEYYLDLFNKMSFSRTVYPENKDQVINDLKEFFLS